MQGVVPANEECHPGKAKKSPLTDVNGRDNNKLIDYILQN